jgi:hypothetical protein
MPMIIDLTALTMKVEELKQINGLEKEQIRKNKMIFVYPPKPKKQESPSRFDIDVPLSGFASSQNFSSAQTFSSILTFARKKLPALREQITELRHMKYSVG